MIGSRLIPILLIVGAGALFIAYTQPTYGGSIATLKTEIRDLDMALDAAEQFKMKEVELTRQRSLISPEQLARLDAFLPDSVDNVQLIVDLNSLAARSGVVLSDFDIAGSSDAEETENPQATGAPMPGAAPMAAGPAAAPMGSPTTLALTAGQPTESLELSVAATGSYAAFRTFLAGVEQSLRPLDVVELSVDDSNTGVYTYDITFRLYWLR